MTLKEDLGRAEVVEVEEEGEVKDLMKIRRINLLEDVLIVEEMGIKSRIARSP